MSARGFTFSCPPAQRPEAGPLLFASGLSRPGNAAPFIDAGAAIGAVAGELSAPMLSRLVEYLDRGGKVFVDSGAFPLFRLRQRRGEAGAALDFDAILEVYEALARRTCRPEGLFVVAPDVIGDQVATLDLLREQRPACRRLVGLGARLLVPLQRGPLGGLELYLAAQEALGGLDFVPALPFNARAYSADEAVAFLEEVRPRRVHLLGGGQRKLAEVAERAPAGVTVQGDANRLRAWVGEGRVERFVRAAFMDDPDQESWAHEPDYAALVREARHEAIWKLAAWELGTEIARIPSFLGGGRGRDLESSWAGFLPPSAVGRLEAEREALEALGGAA